MTYQEMLVQIPRLSTREQLQLLELLSRSLREALTPPAAPSSSAERLLGIIKTDTELTDAEIDQIRYEHLMGKLS